MWFDFVCPCGAPVLSNGAARSARRCWSVGEVATAHRPRDSQSGCGTWAAVGPQPAMAVDSAAVFGARLAELNLLERLPRFLALGWSTHGNFAFALPAGAGGSVDDDEFSRKVVRPLFELADADEMPAAASAVRRLWFESHTLTVSELRSKLERTEGDGPRKVPQAEREARKAAIRARLSPGLLVEGDLEPANCVIDRFCQMLDEGVLEYVAWEDVPKREQELAAAPAKRKWAADAAGVVREKVVRVDPAADVSSALRVSWALQRRGVALELAGLMGYEVHERIRNKLMTALTRESPDPRYATASLDQLRAADKEIWKQLSNQARGKLRANTPADAPPLEALVDPVLAMLEVNLILMPLPKAGGAKRKPGDKDQDSPDRAKSTRSRRRSKQVENLRRQLDEARAPGGSRPQARQQPVAGKVGEKGRGRGFGPAMPKLLWGGVAETADGQRICFGYNLGTCTKVAPGEKCDKGKHQCTRKGCGGLHKALDCAL